MNNRLSTAINGKLIEQLRLAYVRLDASMRVTEFSNNMSDYGFDQLQIGRQGHDAMDFMVGIESPMALELPLVISPCEKSVSVSLMPDESGMTILLTDASLVAEHRQKLQQAANENELLVHRQKRLMAELEDASAALAHKNEQLSEAARLQTSFLSGVSHEFRTPLTSIMGYTELLHQNLSSYSESSSANADIAHLQAVQRSSKHLLSLVENLLDHGKLDSGEIVIRPKHIALSEVFADVELLLQPLCDSKQISLSFELDLPDNLWVVIDDSRLRQCLINLTGNAVKFTDQGGVTVLAEWRDDELTLSVHDTGPGISEDDLNKIRLPFWQGEHSGKVGTGLGLTITERIVELMAGELSIESQLGEGTRVMLRIPAPGVEPEGLDDIATVSAENLKLLLAEDDADISDLLTMQMHEREVQVTAVGNGAQAVNAVQSNSFDLILMDIHMPVLDGYEAIERIKAVGCETPIIVMSASPLDEDQGRAQQLGCQGYLVKPVDVDDLLVIAAQIVGDQDA